ncbi:PadR family transcriptional regulator [Actinotalea subterranea]|uniref:PadR family transcriptional regulator n=1 Tax=Actinotalea subterranea TaxID=2607497 RepID=UPI0011ED02FE|nr:PadR family transcriptional regulator [Actinotalea subterranea]
MRNHDHFTQPEHHERHFRPAWPDGPGDGPDPFAGGRGGPDPFSGGRGGPHRGHRGGPPMGGPRGFRGPGGHRGRGRARGDVRSAILLLLDEQPRHGYELIQEIAERSSGSWTPSPGSVYPTLQALEDEGLVTIESIEGRKTASLTPAGSAHVEENRDRLGTPWTVDGEDHGPALAFREEFLALRDAVRQVARVGSPAQHTAAATAIAAARKELYRLLAQDTSDDI